MKKLSIIIPFLNEEKTIWTILEKIINIDLNFKKEIILINDWSNDKSEQIINNFLNLNKENINVIYLKNEKNEWKWYSLKKWFQNATWDYFIVQDADLEYDPNDYKRLLEKVESENLDFVYGSRTRWYLENGFKYSYITFLIWGLIVSILTSIVCLKLVTDEPTCYKIFSSKLKGFLLTPNESWFEWEPSVTVLLLRKWFNYWEVWIKYFPRKAIDWKKIKWKDWFKAIFSIIKWRLK